MTETLTQQIGRFVQQLRFEALPGEVVNKARTAILHAIGAGLAGFDTKNGDVAIKVAKSSGRKARGGATILVDGSRVDAPAAAFANATMFHALAWEDTYLPGLVHSGVLIIPTACAVGETLRASGKALITAVAAGYEIAARISNGFAKPTVARGFRTTTVYGPACTALTAAKMMDLDEDQTANAMGWGANLAFGVTEWGMAKTDEMPLQAGFVASIGIQAARLASYGSVTAPTVLEGNRGIYNAFAGTRDNLDRIVDKLGQRWDMLDTALKRNPAGGHSQTPVLAMLKLASEQEFRPEQVEKIDIILNPDETKYPGYNTMKTGLISCRYLVANAAIYRRMTAAQLSRYDDPAVLSLMPRMNITDEPSMKHQACRLEVYLKGGRRLTRELDMSGNAWSFSFAEEAKWQKEVLVPQMAIGRENALKMIDMLRDLERLDNIGELMRLLVNPGRKSAAYRIVF